jgi:hypothetical protein
MRRQQAQAPPNLVQEIAWRAATSFQGLMTDAVWRDDSNEINADFSEALS